MAKYHANGDMDDPLVNWEFDETITAIESENNTAKTSYVSSPLSPDIHITDLPSLTSYVTRPTDAVVLSSSLAVPEPT
jgi:hypothetical protein